MKVVFLGTSELAAEALVALHESDHEVTMVVTQPDRGAGRGRKPKAPPVKVAAEKLGLSVEQPESVNTRAFRAMVREHNPDVLVVAAFGQIIRPLLLSMPPHGCLNIHASILPRHRGASPIHAAILSGDEEVGVSIMKLDEGMDTGPVGLVGREPADPMETAGELHDRLAKMGAGLIVEALDKMAQGELTFEPQDDALSTHAGKLQKTDGHVRFDKPVAEVHRQVRGMTPWPGCYGAIETDNGEKRVILGASRPVSYDGDRKPGEIVDVTSEGIVVACSSGALLIAELKPAGKRMMSVSEFLNGSPVSVGANFKGANDE